VRVLVLVATLAAGVALELGTGRLGFHPVLAAAGVACCAAGVVLHHRARQALGSAWSATAVVHAAQPLVTAGPYAVVRHPVYLSAYLLATGTLLAHPSAATVSGALGLGAGLALKLRAEERLLRAGLGAAWAEYAARVPALLPRVNRGRRR
jgi:protein-S-isoprenylcysteine O-methyltransferase Ste14